MDHTMVTPSSRPLPDAFTPTIEQPARHPNNHRRRVLVVDACVPTPDRDSGSLRMANLLELFVELDWRVTFAAATLEFHTHYGQQLQRQGIEVLERGMIGSMRQFLRWNGHAFDLVVLSRHYVAAPLLHAVREYAPHARVWFDTVDLHFLRELRALELRPSERARRIAERSKRQELALMHEADLTLVVSEAERQLLAQEAPRVRVEILSNIHDSTPTITPFAERDAILFIGGFRHRPNVDAVRYYVHEILPRVREQLGEVPLFIIGSHPPRAVRRLATQTSGVHVTGYINDVTPYFARARLSIAPLRYGAGVKGKINMSMAFGVPVVATPCAAEGMFLRNAHDILIGAETHSFADAVVELYRNPILWERLARNGLRNLETHFSRRTARATLERLLGELDA